MKFRWLFSAFFFSLSALSFAIDWPSASSSVDANFGLNEEGRPLIGLIFSGEEKVRAAESGTVIFSTTDPYSQSSFSAPLGAWKAIEHGDGIVSIYARLSPTKEEESHSIDIEKGSILAHGGLSGWTNEQGFLYALFDRIATRWVNPTLISTQRLDTSQPIIHQIVLIARDGTSVNPRTAKTIRQGTWRVQIETNDNENPLAPLKLGPQEISILVNGIEEQNLRFDYFTAVEGDFIIPSTPARSVKEVYTKEGLYDLGELRLSRGRTTMQIIVRDAVGNERQVVYTIRVE